MFVKQPSYKYSLWPRIQHQRPTYEGGMVSRGEGIYEPYLKKVIVTGPHSPSSETPDVASRRRIFTCRPTVSAEQQACATTILTALARRAYRRPVTSADVQPLLGFYARGRKESDSFDGGIEFAIRALLISPEFLFRIEKPPASVRPVAATAQSRPVKGASTYRIRDLELASRLSFFLWSSPPDDELLNVAARGELRTPAQRERQVRRMLAGPRAQALTRNFFSQWFQLRKLELVEPYLSMFPSWDETLRDALEQETVLLLDSIRTDDRSVIELLTANYTFLNERLATHYGIPGIRGSHFRRVTLPADSPRGGILGQASLLAITSQANRTSPVVRGKWILDTILASPPPDPPANVPPLAEPKPAAEILTAKEKMALHRRNPVCASCHAMIDPAGFALENFDAIGQWRDVDESGKPIDVSGSLPDGSRFNSYAEFRDAVLRRPDRFLNTLTEKMLTYALGRGLDYRDMSTVRAITKRAARDENRFSALVLGIVESTPFQMRKLSSEPAVTVAEDRQRALRKNSGSQDR